MSANRAACGSSCSQANAPDIFPFEWKVSQGSLNVWNPNQMIPDGYLFDAFPPLEPITAKGETTRVSEILCCHGSGCAIRAPRSGGRGNRESRCSWRKDRAPRTWRGGNPFSGRLRSSDAVIARKNAPLDAPSGAKKIRR
jgi:hypothetical protein